MKVCNKIVSPWGKEQYGYSRIVWPGKEMTDLKRKYQIDSGM